MAESPTQIPLSSSCSQPHTKVYSISVNCCTNHFMHRTFHRYGPLIRLWCMRYEGKHKHFKQIARRSTYKNVCLTLSKFHQRQQAFKLRCSSAFATVHCETGASKFLNNTFYVMSTYSYYHTIWYIILYRKKNLQFAFGVYLEHFTNFSWQYRDVQVMFQYLR